MIFYIARALDVSPSEILGDAPNANESLISADVAFVHAFDRPPSQKLKQKIAVLVESLAKQAAG